VPHLKVTVFFGTGVTSWVDFPAAERLGITVRRVIYPTRSHWTRGHRRGLAEQRFEHAA